VIARILLENHDCRIFLVGDAACVVLEAGWEKEERVICLSGELGIRDTLAIAKEVDVVIGCETGVLNAVAFEDNRKVVLLSHSSHENLTKHWDNTIALVPNGLDCYPCHRLHYTREFCKEDKETGAAMCQRLIDPADVYQAVVWKEQAVA
jgi:ADP-heptose:LPS heptosyltransferase